MGRNMLPPLRGDDYQVVDGIVRFCNTECGPCIEVVDEESGVVDLEQWLDECDLEGIRDWCDRRLLAAQRLHDKEER